MSSFSSSRWHSRGGRSVLLLAFAFFAAGAITFWVPQARWLAVLNQMPIVCPLRRLTGFLCSFCGMTHAWIYFWHFHWASAAAENKLAIPLFVGTPLVLGSIRFSNFWTESRTRWGIIFAMTILVSYTLIRNL